MAGQSWVVRTAALGCIARVEVMDRQYKPSTFVPRAPGLRGLDSSRRKDLACCLGRAGTCLLAGQVEEVIAAVRDIPGAAKALEAPSASPPSKSAPDVGLEAPAGRPEDDLARRPQDEAEEAMEGSERRAAAAVRLQSAERGRRVSR